MNIVKYLEGKKTYLVSALTVAYGVYQTYHLTGGTWRTFVPWVLSGAGLAALRAGVSKVGK